MVDTVPKDPHDMDRTLKALLDLIQVRNENGDILTEYSIETTKVILTFQAAP